MLKPLTKLIAIVSINTFPSLLFLARSLLNHECCIRSHFRIGGPRRSNSFDITNDHNKAAFGGATAFGRSATGMRFSALILADPETLSSAQRNQTVKADRNGADQAVDTDIFF